MGFNQISWLSIFFTINSFFTINVNAKLSHVFIKKVKRLIVTEQKWF